MSFRSRRRVLLRRRIPREQQAQILRSQQAQQGEAGEGGGRLRRRSVVRVRPQTGQKAEIGRRRTEESQEEEEEGGDRGRSDRHLHGLRQQNEEGLRQDRGPAEPGPLGRGDLGGHLGPGQEPGGQGGGQVAQRAQVEEEEAQAPGGQGTQAQT